MKLLNSLTSFSSEPYPRKAAQSCELNPRPRDSANARKALAKSVPAAT